MENETVLPTRKRSYDKAADQARSKAWREANPERHRDNHLRWRHGISTLELAQLIVDQGGVCKICSGPISLEGKRGFAVDHDHECCPGNRSCGKCIRGVLCSNCNIGIGNLGDDPERLRAAADYLDTWKKARHG